jgi:membrane protein
VTVASDTSRVERWSARARDAGVRLRERARRLPGADIVEYAIERDRSTAASLLAGGVAFRLFLWLVPFGLVITAVGSFWVEGSRQTAEEAAQDFGMGAAAAAAAAEALEGQSHSSWYYLVVGVALLTWFSIGAVKSLRIASGIAWNERPVRLRRSLRAGWLFTGVIVALLTLSLLAQWVREQIGPAGILVMLGLVLVDVAVVVRMMALLPNRAPHWRALVPGAVLVAVGSRVLQVVTVVYFAPKLGRSSELYGALGAATVILLWLYFTARLFVAGLFLNAARAGARTTSPTPAL